MKKLRPQRLSSVKKEQRKDKEKPKSKRPNFIKTFFLAFWITGTSAEFLMWVTDGLFTWALNTALTKFATSVLASTAVLIIRIIFYQTKPIRSKYMSKISNFFKRCGAYIKANKRTFGGILTSLLSGASTVTVTILGYTVNLTEVVSQIEGLAWLQNININGFDLTPLIVLVVGGLFCVWNTVAAVSRGWESPEEYTAKNEEEALAKAEAEKLKAEQEAEDAAKAEAEAEIAKAKADAQAEIDAEKAAKEQAEKEKAEAQAKAEEEAEKAKEQAEYRAKVEKYKAELLAAEQQASVTATDTEKK